MADADPKIEPPATVHEPGEPGTETIIETEAEPRRRWGRLTLMLVVPLAIVIGGAIYWLGLQGKVSTDDAYVKQDKVSISAEVGGKIDQVYVKNGDHVKAGDLLYRIDPQPFKIQLDQATAAIAAAQANVTALANAAPLSGADIAKSREDIAFAQSNFQRQQELWKQGFTTKAAYDAARHAVEQGEAELKAAQASEAEARAKLAHGAAIPGENPEIAAAQAQAEAAKLNLSRTVVRAPMAGEVAGAERLLPGQLVVQNVPMLTLVGISGAYVEANYKETQLADMRVGQPAEIKFDAYPGMKLRGHVAAIGAGTGSEFSVLPAQNATGNWVKVTQRVPVRIAIDSKSDRKLIAGLTTHVTVFTDGKKH
ncbi:MAG TPA: HlyD family secretion protein [Croceibacterium sp.]|jgi:membrane fusion protein (multidrug efflux system)